MLIGGEGAGGEGRNGLICEWGSRYGPATNWELGEQSGGRGLKFKHVGGKIKKNDGQKEGRKCRFT